MEPDGVLMKKAPSSSVGAYAVLRYDIASVSTDSPYGQPKYGRRSSGTWAST
jgi:hypothetical protein